MKSNVKIFIGICCSILMLFITSLIFRQELLTKTVVNRQVFFTKYFLFIGADPNKLDEQSNKSPIFLAIDHKVDSTSTDLLRILVKSQNCCSSISNDTLKVNPLTISIIQKKKEFVTILSKQCEINANNQNGIKPICYAIEDIDMIKYLIKLGASFENIDSYGNNLFHLYHNFPLLKFLNNEFPNSINSTNNFGQTPLISAITNNNARQVANLLELNADVNIPDKNGFYPISKASQYGNTAITSFILKKGADINQENSDGSTAIFFAESPKMFNYLTNHGADIYEEDEEGNNILHSIDNIQTLDMALRVLDLVSIEKSNKKGKTPLMKAAANGNEQKFFKLFKSNTICTSDLLYLAEQGGNQAIITTLRSRPIMYAESRIARDILVRSATRRLGARAIAKGFLRRVLPGVGTVLMIYDIYNFLTE